MIIIRNKGATIHPGCRNFLCRNLTVAQIGFPITYGNNHWNGKEKIDISKEKDDAVILEISAKGKRAIQLKEKNEFEQNIVQVDKSADDLPAYSGMYDVDKTISSSLENCSKEELFFIF